MVHSSWSFHRVVMRSNGTQVTAQDMGRRWQGYHKTQRMRRRWHTESDDESQIHKGGLWRQIFLEGGFHGRYSKEK